jgi:peptidyl-prolyl cis-trans isomerase A (cyclophilin A)
MSNIVGTLTFATAGPNTRTTQLYFNLADNSFLDSQGFAPFAKVTKGWNYITNINMQCKWSHTRVVRR